VLQYLERIDPTRRGKRGLATPASTRSAGTSNLTVSSPHRPRQIPGNDQFVSPRPSIYKRVAPSTQARWKHRRRTVFLLPRQNALLVKNAESITARCFSRSVIVGNCGRHHMVERWRRWWNTSAAKVGMPRSASGASSHLWRRPGPQVPMGQPPPGGEGMGVGGLRVFLLVVVVECRQPWCAKIWAAIRADRLLTYHGRLRPLRLDSVLSASAAGRRLPASGRLSSMRTCLPLSAHLAGNRRSRSIARTASGSGDLGVITAPRSSARATIFASPLSDPSTLSCTSMRTRAVNRLEYTAEWKHASCRDRPLCGRLRAWE